MFKKNKLKTQLVHKFHQQQKNIIKCKTKYFKFCWEGGLGPLGEKPNPHSPATKNPNPVILLRLPLILKTLAQTHRGRDQRTNHQCCEREREREKWFQVQGSAPRGWLWTRATTCWEDWPRSWPRSFSMGKRWWWSGARRFASPGDSWDRRWSTCVSSASAWTPNPLMAPFTSGLPARSSGAPFVG